MMITCLILLPGIQRLTSVRFWICVLRQKHNPESTVIPIHRPSPVRRVKLLPWGTSDAPKLEVAMASSVSILNTQLLDLPCCLLSAVIEELSSSTRKALRTTCSRMRFLVGQGVQVLVLDRPLYMPLLRQFPNLNCIQLVPWKEVRGSCLSMQMHPG